MNSLLQEEFPLDAAQAERYQLLEVLTDDDLTYKLPGDNLTLGELFREMGEVEQNYIESFKTFKYEPSYRNTEPDLSTTRDRLQEWYRSLDQEFEAVIREFSDDELNTKEIDRGNGFKLSLRGQFGIFHEAVLIFYAKISIYLKALQKRIDDQWHVGIG